MEILLIGEYSGVYNTLAQGFKELGHKVLLASKGDLWKNYPRDLDLNAADSKALLKKLVKNFNKFIGHDIVLLINPLFLFSGSSSLHLNNYIFDFLRFTNKKIYLSAIGDDYFWVKACLEKRFKYSPFTPLKNFGNLNGHYKIALNMINKNIELLSNKIAGSVIGIIAGAYVYYTAYKFTEYSDKLVFIPFPVNTKEIFINSDSLSKKKNKIVFFIGIQEKRTDWKGTNIILPLLERFEKKYPKDVLVNVARSVPFALYTDMMNEADVVIDQLYSHSPGMNGLLAMAKGKILMGGGEEEHYQMINENEIKPIINIIPSEKQIFSSLEFILDNKPNLGEMKQQSRSFVEKHHNYIDIANKYLKFCNYNYL